MVAVAKPHTSRSFYTSEDLERLSADGGRYELLRGELFETAPAGYLHGVYTIRLASSVTVFIEEHDLGDATTSETGFKVALDPDTVIAPDWAFVVKERAPTPMPKGFAPLAPDLVLETRSHSDTVKELTYQAIIWLQAGVQVVWALDPMERTLVVYRKDHSPQTLGPEDVLDGDALLPGFTYPLSRLFREPVPDPAV